MGGGVATAAAGRVPLRRHVPHALRRAPLHGDRHRRALAQPTWSTPQLQPQPKHAELEDGNDDDLESGGADRTMVLVQITMFNQKQVSIHT
jgi:hypothetical protein